MLDDFLVRAALGGIGVALVAGPLGCFVVWRRMAFFGHALAHSALLGVGLGAVLALPMTLTTLVVCLVCALILATFQGQRLLADDAVLGIVAQATLALGLILVAFVETVRIDLVGYLFGDLLSVGRMDLLWIYLGGAGVLALLVALWPSLLRLTLDEELAQAEGVRLRPVRLLFMLLMATSVAIGMKVVGVLLVVSLLVIPAAAARPFARTPEQMACLAASFGVIATLLGLGASMLYDSPSGPSVVVAAAVLFVLAMIWRRLAGARPT